MPPALPKIAWDQNRGQDTVHCSEAECYHSSPSTKASWLYSTHMRKVLIHLRKKEIYRTVKREWISRGCPRSRDCREGWSVARPPYMSPAISELIKYCRRHTTHAFYDLQGSGGQLRLKLPWINLPSDCRSTDSFKFKSCISRNVATVRWKMLVRLQQ